MAAIVSKYTDRIERMRVGWTVRLRNGALARITWIADNGVAYSAKAIEPQAGEGSAEHSKAHKRKANSAGEQFPALFLLRL